MKTTIVKLANGILILLILSISILSCSKENDDIFNYEGKWEASKDNYKSVLILSENTFQSQSYWLIDNSYYLYAKSTGDLLVINDSLDMTLNKMEVDVSYTKTGIPDGYLTTYNREDIPFTEETAELWHIIYKYDLQGDSLELLIDSISIMYHRIP